MKLSPRHESASNRAAKISSTVGLSVAFAAIAPMFLTAHAQDADQEEEARQEVVIVSATKRDESIQDVAASITQIGGADLVERGLDDLEGLTSQVPNLSWGRYLNSTFVTIRGIGTTVDSGVAEPSVALYVDGVFLPRATMGTLRQVDLQRVETLRGPQGTLYGRNATGGAVNFISQKPTDVFEGGMTASIEERNGYGVNGYVSGPLGDKVAVRLSGGIQNQDGYVDVLNTGEQLGGTDLFHARAAATFDLTSDATLDLSLQHEKNEDNFVWASISTPPTGLLGFYAAFGPPGTPTPNFTTEPNQIVADGPHEGLLETTIAAATLNWDLNENISFRSVTGYVDHTSGTEQESDATDVLFVNLTDTVVTSESFSQEFNLIGETGPLNWLLGAYYFEEEHTLTGALDFDTLAVTLGNGVPFDPALLPLFGVPTNFTFVDLVENTTTYAVFADATLDVTDRFRILAGARLNSEEKEYLFFGVPSPAGDLTADDFLPKLGVQYDVTENANIYAQWQLGIKSGGHQLSTPALFGSEEVSSYEIGLKSQSDDGRLIFNTSAFFYDYTDLQASVTIPPNTTLVENGDAEIFGLEAELFYSPTTNIDLNFGASLLSSEYTDLASADQTLPGAPLVDLTGEDVIRSPDFTLNAGATFNIPMNSTLLSNIALRGDVFHTDSFKLALFPYEQTTQDAYTTVNLSATFTDASGHWQLRGFINNATDELYLNNAAFLATTGAFIANHNEPRTAGVSLSARF